MNAHADVRNRESKVDPLPWVEEQIAADKTFTENDVVAATGATHGDVDALLRFLNLLGHIIKDPEGPVRGPEVRWIRKPGSR